MIKFFAVFLALALPPIVYFSTLGERRQQKLNAAHAQVEELDLRIEQAKAVQRKLPQFRAEMARLGTELDTLQHLLPPALPVDDVRSLTESLAAENNVELTHFDPGTPQQDNALQWQSMTAEVVGSAENTAEFLKKISHASRVINVSGVNVTKDPAGWRTDFVMTTYAMR